MTAEPPIVDAPGPLDANPQDIALAAYNQNHETFRALNSLMWQIPLIAMTLNGGLWFGVSKVEEASIFRIGLLSLAFVGDLGLAVVRRGCASSWANT